jgi:hypothetical protein
MLRVAVVFILLALATCAGTGCATENATAPTKPQGTTTAVEAHGHVEGAPTAQSAAPSSPKSTATWVPEAPPSATGTAEPTVPARLPPKHMPPNATITLERLGSCRDAGRLVSTKKALSELLTCDAYTIELHADGRYDIWGRAIKTGSEGRRIAAASVRALWAQLHRAGFFNAAEKMIARHGGSARLDATWPGGSKSVRHTSYQGPEYPLARIADRIDGLVRVKRHLQPVGERGRGL